jgi:cyclopropane-fatty-acyl-phospholipid synthase
MVEHVGEALLPTYFEKAWRLLKPGGVFLCHGIACYTTEPRPATTSFSDRYVFPDGELVPLHVLLRHAEKAGFEVRDVESLREHYVLTLRHWRRRLEAHEPTDLQFVDPVTYRVWRIFLAGAAHRLAANLANVYQTLLVKPVHNQSGMPLTRADWYASGL